MHCEQAEMLLAEMAFGSVDLDDRVARELNEHLEGCQACREQLGDMRVVAKLVNEGVHKEEGPVLSDDRVAALLDLENQNDDTPNAETDPLPFPQNADEKTPSSWAASFQRHQKRLAVAASIALMATGSAVLLIPVTSNAPHGGYAIRMGDEATQQNGSQGSYGSFRYHPSDAGVQAPASRGEDYLRLDLERSNTDALAESNETVRNFVATTETAENDDDTSRFGDKSNLGHGGVVLGLPPDKDRLDNHPPITERPTESGGVALPTLPALAKVSDTQGLGRDAETTAVEAKGIIDQDQSLADNDTSSASAGREVALDGAITSGRWVEGESEARALGRRGGSGAPRGVMAGKDLGAQPPTSDLGDSESAAGVKGAQRTEPALLTETVQTIEDLREPNSVGFRMSAQQVMNLGLSVEGAEEADRPQAGPSRDEVAGGVVDLSKERPDMSFQFGALSLQDFQAKASAEQATDDYGNTPRSQRAAAGEAVADTSVETGVYETPSEEKASGRQSGLSSIQQQALEPEDRAKQAGAGPAVTVAPASAPPSKRQEASPLGDRIASELESEAMPEPLSEVFEVARIEADLKKIPEALKESRIQRRRELPAEPADPEPRDDLRVADPDFETSGEDDEITLPPASQYPHLPVNPFVMTADDNLSTFAIDVDTASYTLARRFIRNGYRPPIGSVRMEEFINAFDYNYPTQSERAFTVHTTAAPAPYGQNLTLVKVGVKARVVGRDGRKPAHLTLVVDASGSMDQSDRLPLVKHSLKLMIDQLHAADSVTLITYGTHAQLLLQSVSASNKDQIKAAIDAVQAGGSTNMIEALSLGYEQARAFYKAGYINRVMLCSDGVANIGDTDARSMLSQVDDHRRHGITFTSVGFGLGVYNDALLEKLADRGDGFYAYVDSRLEARRLFVTRLSSTLQTVAKDAKIQVEFNPQRVRRYRLIGYENRDVADKDFRNDTIDAGEVGSGQSATALYEVELLDQAAGLRPQDLGAVYVRYQDVETQETEEISQRLNHDMVQNLTVEQAPYFHLAASVGEFAEQLRSSEHTNAEDMAKLRQTVTQLRNQLPLNNQVLELQQLIELAQGLPSAP
ncbi:MAG: vWA domain-containing protein [Planctomycetota bacterium]|jgi:Ca-activated chloride channel family protein